MRLAAVLLGALVLQLGMGLAQDTKVQSKSFDQVVSENCAFFASVKSAGELRQKMDEEPLSKIRENAQMKKWLDGVMTNIAEATKGTGEAADLSAVEVFNAIGGEIAFAIDELDFTDTNNPQPKSITLLTDTKDKKADFEKVWEKIAKNFEKKDYAKGTDKIGDVEVTRFEKETEKDGKKKRDVALLANVESVFVICSEEEGLRKTLSNLKAKDAEKVLATNPGYKAVRAKLGNTDAQVYMNLTFLKEIAKAAPENMKEIVEKALDEFGISSLKAAGAGVALEKEGVKVSGYLYVPDKKGLFATLGKNDKIDFPKWVPDDAAQVSVTRLEAAQLWKILDKFIEIAQEQLKAQGQEMDLKEVMKSFLGIDLKEDVFDTLSDTICGFTKYTKPYDKDGSDKSCVAVKSKDEKKLGTSMQTLFDTLANMPQVQIEDEEYQGKKIWKLSGQGMQIGVTVAGSNLLGGDVDSMKEVIRRLDKEKETVFDSEHFKALAKGLPDKLIGFTYVSTEGMSWEITQLKAGKNPILKIPNVPGVKNNQAQFEKFLHIINAKELPDPEVFTKYVYGSIGYLVADDSGFHLVSELKYAK